MALIIALGKLPIALTTEAAVGRGITLPARLVGRSVTAFSRSGIMLLIALTTALGRLPIGGAPITLMATERFGLTTAVESIAPVGSAGRPRRALEATERIGLMTAVSKPVALGVSDDACRGSDDRIDDCGGIANSSSWQICDDAGCCTVGQWKVKIVCSNEHEKSE